jgi:hypothetical protein
VRAHRWGGQGVPHDRADVVLGVAIEGLTQQRIADPMALRASRLCHPSARP